MLPIPLSYWRNLKILSWKIFLVKKWRSSGNLSSEIFFTLISRNIFPWYKNLTNLSKTSILKTMNTSIFCPIWLFTLLISEVQPRSFQYARLGRWRSIYNSAISIKWRENLVFLRLHSWRILQISAFFPRTKVDFLKLLWFHSIKLWISFVVVILKFVVWDSTLRIIFNSGRPFMPVPFPNPRRRRRRKRK